MAIIPSNTQFRGDTTGVPIVEKGSAQTQARAGIFTMADIAQSIIPDPNADVYSNTLFTNVGESVANIISYTTGSSLAFQTVDDILDYGGGEYYIDDYNGNLPIFNVGDQFTLKNSDNSEFVSQIDNINQSDSYTLNANTTLISGTDQGSGYVYEIGIDSTSTVINIDTDLTSTVNVGDQIILAALLYTVSAITSSSITISALVANIGLISTVEIASDFAMLSYKATLSNDTNVEKTPILSYNLETQTISINSGIISTIGSNVGIGADVLYSNTTGVGNTASGYQSLYSNANGSRNVTNGYQSLYFNINGEQNVANGYQALYSNTGGGDNIANGYGALYFNTTGNSNVAVGKESLRFNTTGNNNVAVGRNSLYANTTGQVNVALGFESLRSNTSGSNNTASGYQSLYSNTTGVGLTAIGSGSLRSNTTGNNNTSVGQNSLYANSTGAGNTGTGNRALRFNTTGSSNTANGLLSLDKNTTGNNNTAVGYYSLEPNTTGNDNTAIGYDTDSGNFSGSTILGHNALATASNQFVVGSVGTVAGAVTVTAAPQGKVWNVVINGVNEQILLA